MAGRFEGRVALVTGSSSGIGRATALAFAREGASVVVSDVAEDGGQETVRMIEGTGGKALFVKADVTEAKDVERLVDQAVQTYGRLDCAHNNAGIAGPVTQVADYPEEEWNRVIAINLKGVWLCMKYELPQMLKQGGGAIINTASIEGLVAVAGNSAYDASKHGVAGLTKTAAIEYARDNIRVNAVCPGYIDTPMVQEYVQSIPGLEETTVGLHPIGRIGKPEEIAEAVVWLCSDAASFVTGHTMTVDGGYVAQ